MVTPKSASTQVVNIIKKHVPVQEKIDGGHRLVQEVMLAGYTEERSIEAVEKNWSYGCSICYEISSRSGGNWWRQSVTSSLPAAIKTKLYWYVFGEHKPVW